MLLFTLINNKKIDKEIKGILISCLKIFVVKLLFKKRLVNFFIVTNSFIKSLKEMKGNPFQNWNVSLLKRNQYQKNKFFLLGGKVLKSAILIWK